MSCTQLFVRRRLGTLGLYSLALLVAAAAHAGLSLGAQRLRGPRQVAWMEMTLVSASRAPTPVTPPPVAIAPEPAERPRPTRTLKPRPVRDRRRFERRRPARALPPPNQRAAPAHAAQDPVPIVTGISLHSTVHGGAGPSVRVGNTLYGDIARERFVPPVQVQPYAYAPVPAHRITTEPEVLVEVKVPMPEAARQAGIQGTVVLRVEVRRSGQVGQVTVIRGPGHGLDEAAAAALRRFRFRPATVDGVPVDYTIRRYYYVFELVG